MNKDEVPKQVRDYMAAIGSRGGAASKGTEAAKIRSGKAQQRALPKK